MATPKIPGLDVTELDGPAGRAAMRDALGGPSNPSFSSGASPQAAQYQSMRTPPSVPDAAATADAVAAAPASTSRIAQIGSGLRTVVNSGAGRVIGGLAAADAIGQGMNEDSTVRYAKRFGLEEPTGDGSFGDMAKFAGLRALGFASDLGNNLTGGMAGKYLYADKQPGVMPPAPSAATAMRAPQVAAAAPAPQPGLTPSQAQPVGAPDNVVTRNGNSFSGNNIREGFTYSDGSRPGSLTSVPTMATLDPALASRLADARAAAVDRGESLATNQPAMSLGGGNGPNIEALARSGRLTAAGLNAVLGARGQDIGAATAARGQDVQAHGQNLNYDLGLRGQDVAMRGQDLSSATARAQARMQQMQQDRVFQLDVAKFGQEKAKTMWDQREKASKDFNDWAGSLFTTRDDKGQVIADKGKQAEFMRTVSASLGNLISDLEAKGDKTSMQRADELKSKGFAALDDSDKSLLKRLFDRRQRFVDTRGASPFAGSGAVSDNLYDFAITGPDNGAVQKRVGLRGGQSLPVNDLRYTEPANAVLPDWFKTPTADLGPTNDEQALLRHRGLR